MKMETLNNKGYSILGCILQSLQELKPYCLPKLLEIGQAARFRLEIATAVCCPARQSQQKVL